MLLQKTHPMLVGFYLVILLGLVPSAYALQWQDVANELMSPACPGRTLVNCTSGQSEQLRELIRQKIDQGESKSAIIRYFVDMHGEEILAAPPKKGFALAAWLLPLFVVLNGAGLIMILTFRWTRNRVHSKPDVPVSLDDSTTSVTLAMDPYQQRLRRELDEMDA
jgi:cytochrome c-type biogenesis protein CcmH/NrfF